MEFQIDKNIPIPKFRKGRALLWPWEKMEQGDSIEINKERLGAAISSYRGYQRKFGGEVKFKHKTEGNSARIWRVK